jgi:hypothetical protein
MAKYNPSTITIPIDLPRDEFTALAQLVKRLGYEDVNRFAAPSNHLRRPPRRRCDVVGRLHAPMPAGRSRLRATLRRGEHDIRLARLCRAISRCGLPLLLA